MGKYPRSKIHDDYSDWHYQNEGFQRDAFLTDVDRIWVEVRKGRPIAAMDLKELDAPVTYTEKVVYDWLEEKGLPMYIVSVFGNFDYFLVKRWQNGKEEWFSANEYRNWINNLSERIF